MPHPALRTRSKKRKHHSLPGGRNKVLYKKEKTGNPRCSSCGCNLTFLPHSVSKIRKLPRTQKRIGRIYSGQLCPNCLQNLLKQASRNL